MTATRSNNMVRNIRRFTQIALLVLFVYLLVNTRYNGQDIITLPVDLFFKLNPLVMLTPFFSQGVLLKGISYSVALLIFTIFLGKFFCGWFCPMGTTLDLFSRTLDWIHKKRKKFSFSFMRHWQYMILIFILTSTVFGLQLIWFFDPITILFRTITTSIYPAFNLVTRSIFNGLYETSVSSVSEPLYEFIQPVLSFKQPFYQLSLLFLFIFGLILLTEYFERRAWCRYLCPLGAIWSLFSFFPWLSQGVNSKCTKCLKCQKDCKMGAIDDQQRFDKRACIACFNCVEVCPPSAISFEFHYISPDKSVSPDLQKRGLITAAALGIITPPFWFIGGKLKAPDEKLIRPPGALSEKEFLSRCVRCGECLRVCLSNALQPTLFEATLSGMFSPRLIPRIGYCEYNCNLCTQVCPTQAIQRITLPQKQKTIIGFAHFDRNRCLPWAKNQNCLVCEEHCPTPKKAIKFEHIIMPDGSPEKMLKRPFVDENLCIGCGICENKCILRNEPAVIVTSRGESRKKNEIANW